MGTQSYLTVNIYPTSAGWRVAVLVKDPGKPYGRLLHHVTDMPVVASPPDLPGAVQAAVEALSGLFPAANTSPNP